MQMVYSDKERAGELLKGAVVRRLQGERIRCQYKGVLLVRRGKEELLPRNRLNHLLAIAGTELDGHGRVLRERGVARFPKALLEFWEVVRQLQECVESHRSKSVV